VLKVSPSGFVAAIATCALLAGGPAAGAQPSCPPRPDESYQGEMRFTVQSRAGQLPVPVADGVIDRNILPRLEAALDAFEGEEIWLRSSGGEVGVDREAGRLIRSRGLRTRIPPGWTCRGACNFMFLGGIIRAVDEGGLFIVQMFAHTGNLNDVAEVGRSSLRLATDDHRYLIQMGVSTRLLSDIMYREPARVGAPGRCLTPEELSHYNVDTGRPFVGRSSSN